MDTGEARDVALALPNSEEYDHFGKPAYRIAAKKAGGKPGRTFMTLWLEEGYAVLMLDQDLQTDLLGRDPKAYRPHPSKWGEKGATVAELDVLNVVRFQQALEMAHVFAMRK